MESARLAALGAIVFAPDVVEAAGELIARHEQILLVPERRAPREGRDLDAAAHHDRLFRARLLAEAAVHAATHVDVEDLGIALDRVLGLAGLDVDAIDRTRPFAEPARDAALLAVVHLDEDRHAAERRRLHHVLFGEHDRRDGRLAADP